MVIVIPNTNDDDVVVPLNGGSETMVGAHRGEHGPADGSDEAAAPSSRRSSVSHVRALRKRLRSPAGSLNGKATDFSDAGDDDLEDNGRETGDEGSGGLLATPAAPAPAKRQRRMHEPSMMTPGEGRRKTVGRPTGSVRSKRVIIPGLSAPVLESHQGSAPVVDAFAFTPSARGSVSVRRPLGSGSSPLRSIVSSGGTMSQGQGQGHSQGHQGPSQSQGHSQGHQGPSQSQGHSQSHSHSHSKPVMISGMLRHGSSGLSGSRSVQPHQHHGHAEVVPPSARRAQGSSGARSEAHRSHDGSSSRRSVPMSATVAKSLIFTDLASPPRRITAKTPGSLVGHSPSARVVIPDSDAVSDEALLHTSGRRPARRLFDSALAD